MAKNCVAGKRRGAGILAILKEVQKNCHRVDVGFKYPNERKNRCSIQYRAKRLSGLACLVTNPNGWITENIGRRVLDNSRGPGYKSKSTKCQCLPEQNLYICPVASKEVRICAQRLLEQEFRYPEVTM
jgi:hypothetical protein